MRCSVCDTPTSGAVYCSFGSDLRPPAARPVCPLRAVAPAEKREGIMSNLSRVSDPPDMTCDAHPSCPCDGGDYCEPTVLVQFQSLRAEVEILEAEVEEWKIASVLECNGDPDGVTPESMRKYWEGVGDENDRLRATIRKLTEKGCPACAEIARATP